jgi:hypothetical protein
MRKVVCRLLGLYLFGIIVLVGCGSDGNSGRGAAPDSDASLSGIKTSSGTITPVFSASQLTYTVDIANADATITVTPTVSGHNATVKVNDVAVLSGSASTAFSLSVGDNPISIVVTAEDDTTTKTYTITVKRHAALSNNADLASLTVSQGILTPVFSSSVLAYTVDVANAVDAITVTPTAAGANATVKVNDVAVPSGTASSSIALSVGRIRSAS